VCFFEKGDKSDLIENKVAVLLKEKFKEKEYNNPRTQFTRFDKYE
jgi:hypothetical protein